VILSAVLLITYPLVIQYKRGGLWLALAPLTAVALLLDVVANYTEWAVALGRPARGDYTISKRIKTMMQDHAHPARVELARLVQIYLDACEPDGVH
jgi:hypothetical protein